MSQIIYTTQIPSGAHWSLRMRCGTALRLTDLDGGVNAAMLMHNPENLLERYNAPDTLTCQHTFRLTTGHCLYSDMGRIMCSVEQDSFGGHDTMCGTSFPEQIERQFGSRNYQEARNDWHQSGFQSFLVELAKYGLGQRDIASNVNFFADVTSDDASKLTLARQGGAGQSVTLRFAMDTLVLLNTCPHPLSMAESYPRSRLQVELLSYGQPVPDACLSIDENRRGLANNALYYFMTPEQFNQEAK